MEKPYNYKVFGLNVNSEFELPELIPGVFEQADVTIEWGEVPEEITAAVSKGLLFQASPGIFIFRLPTVGAYLVENGTKITVERLNNSTDDEIQLFLLGNAFAAIIHQRGLLPFHASTVVKDEKAFVFAGLSGAGKSSLAATLLNRRFQLLADDISVIDFKNGVPIVYPGIPHTKLWHDVLENLGDDPNNYLKVRPQLLKYRKPANNDYYNLPAKINRIIILSSKNTSGFEIAPVRGIEKFNLLKNNTYRIRFLNGLGQTENHFTVISNLASKVDVYNLKRPNSPLLLEEIANYFESQLFAS